MLADAFLDDPGWVAVGPRASAARHRFIRRTCRGAIEVGARHCGPSWCIVRDGEVAAVLTGAAPGTYPPPRLPTLLRLAPAPLLAGPPTLVRSLQTERVVERNYPDYAHFLVWMFAVSPRHQRGGLGRALMYTALAEADAAEVPAWLWTGNPANLPYYRSHGFDVIGEAPISGGVPNWFMQRPAGG